MEGIAETKKIQCEKGGSHSGPGAGWGGSRRQGHRAEESEKETQAQEAD
jgi:hypothetical protein